MRFRLPFSRFTQADIESVEAWDADIRRRKLLLAAAVAMLILASLGWIGLTVVRSSGHPWSPSPSAPAVVPDPGVQAMAGLDPALLVEDATGATGAEAMRLNAAIPVSALPNPAMPPFAPIADARDLSTAEDCLTTAIYYEAGFEALEGQRAVAQVVLNRVRHPLYPKTVCGVVLQGFERSTGCQFSFTCNGAWAAAPDASRFLRARAVAKAALGGYVDRAVGAATHYHAAYVSPYWAPRLVKVYVSGLHIFYRFPGFFGAPGAMRGRYAGGEFIPDARSSFRTSDTLAQEKVPEIAVATLDLAPIEIPAPLPKPGEPAGTALTEPDVSAIEPGGVKQAEAPPPARRPPATFRDDRPLLPAPAGIRRDGW